MKSSSRLKSSVLLLVAALIWGTAFVAQKDGAEWLQPFTFNSIRCLLGALVLLVILPLTDRVGISARPTEAKDRRTLWLGGLCCGVALCIATNLQQYGIDLQDPATNVGKAGFITACYCALVPIAGLFLRRRSPLTVWLGVLLAVVGFFFLCLMDGVAAGQGLGLGLSDLLLLLCSIAFTAHILVIDHFSPRADGVRLSCIQFAVCGLLCGIPALWEHAALSDIAAAAGAIVFTGIFSSAGAYTLQIIGQKGVHPAVASLLLSLESVFSVLAGFLLQGGRLSRWEVIGCVLVFAAVVLTQLPPPSRRHAKSEG